MDISGCSVNRELEDAQTVMQHLFLPIKTEPDYIRISGNLEATENREDGISSEYALKANTFAAEAVMAPFSLPVKAETDFEGVSEENILQGNSQSSEAKEISMNKASFMIKEQSTEWEESWRDEFKQEPTYPLPLNSKSNGADEHGEHDVSVENMGSSEFSVKANTDNVEVVMSYFFSPFKTEADLDIMSEETILKENSQASEDAEVSMTGANCVVEKKVIDMEKPEPRSQFSLNLPRDGADGQGEHDVM